MPSGDGVRRIAAVLVTDAVGAASPVGAGSAEFCRALVEDSCDLLAGLELVAPAVAMAQGAGAELGADELAELVWPGTPVLQLPAGPGRGPAGEALQALAALGAQQGAVLAADAPDLPPLLIGKLFRALGGRVRRADIAVCPAEGGGLVALAAWLPLAGWVAAALADVAGPGGLVELDDGDVMPRLRAVAPRRAATATVPGWRRLRSPADLRRLDPGLEGWPATRSLLTSHGLVGGQTYRPADGQRRDSPPSGL
jgi:hypothetical protein